jgi:hypothetical protein
VAALADVERMVDDWERDAIERIAAFQQTQAEIEEISITGSTVNGAVSVTMSTTDCRRVSSETVGDDITKQFRLGRRFTTTRLPGAA